MIAPGAIFVRTAWSLGTASGVELHVDTENDLAALLRRQDGVLATVRAAVASVA